MHVGTHGGRNVHQPRIVADRLFRVAQQVDDVLERRPAAQVVRGTRRRDALAGRRILVGTQYPDVVAVVPEQRGQLGKIVQRPALRGAVLGTGHHRDHGLVGSDAERLHHVGLLQPVDRQRRERDRRQCLVGLQAERNESFHGLVENGFVERPHVVDEPVAGLAAKAGSLRYARKPGNERRLQGARQDDRLLVARVAQRVADAAALAEAQFAVPRFSGDAPANLRHACDDRQRPTRRQYVYRRFGPALIQQDEQRLCHHHVADPRGPDDQCCRRGHWLSRQADPGSPLPRPRPAGTRRRSRPRAGE